MLKIKKIFNRKFLKWTMVFLVMITIFRFSSETAVQSTQTSEPIVSRICNLFKICDIETVEFFVRKAAHFSIFFVLGFCVFWAFSEYKITFLFKLASSLLFCLVYALSDEFHQMFVSGRAAMLADIFIDFSGSVVGIGACISLSKLWRIIKLRKKHKNYN